jgi:hypothetical protein
MSDVMTESSRLAAKTHAARKAYLDLDRCGHPIPTKDREVALAAWEAAQAEEAAYWKAINPEED